MVGLTTATDTPGEHPFVDGLVSLAADIRTLLPDAKLSCAADWSEHRSHRSGSDVHFHLDPLWSSPDIDFVAIDNDLPIADWRAGTDHLDHDPGKGWSSIDDLAYLEANIEGGEHYDRYYASEADRDARTHTPIQDGAHGEDWAFRQRAIRDWHGNPHRNRPGGVREAQATPWVPGSKPVWFTEIGCGAVDMGANQPDEFLDPKSSESTLPHYGRGLRDDFMAASISARPSNGGATMAPGWSIPPTSWSGRGTPGPGPSFPPMARPGRTRTTGPRANG